MFDQARIEMPPLRPYPSRRRQPREATWTHALADVTAPVTARVRRLRLLSMAQSVRDRATVYAALNGADWDEELRACAVDARRPEADPIRVMAVLSVLCERHLGLRPYRVQIAGALAMRRRCIIEMNTGEGKSLTTALAAGAWALAGRSVHVITTNDYLAARDAKDTAPLFEALRLPVTTVTHDLEPEERRSAYRASVVYTSNKEVAFDYLRDRLDQADPRLDPAVQLRVARLFGSDGPARVLRGLDVAIVDEADSVLIDDAGTPLLISMADEDAEGLVAAAEALELAPYFQDGRDYKVDMNARVVTLTPDGKDKVFQLTAQSGPVWRHRVRREELLSQALAANVLFRRDEHYLVREGEILIIDETTGRVMEDRFWGRGLHQMIELKEGCQGSAQRRPVASVTFQRFFNQYRHVCGMSGTVAETAGELRRLYDVEMVRIPPRRASRRRTVPPRVYTSRSELRAGVVEQVQRHHKAGQPVLVGVRTVEEAEIVSASLVQAGLSHRRLTAAQDSDEADLVAEAGQRGAITVATRMAGRGTDIKLGPGVAELGGLVVCLCDTHEARRLDRQLIGRCARQGDPGLVERFFSIEDEIVQMVPASVVGLIGTLPWWVQAKVLPVFVRYAQWRAEAIAHLRRSMVLRQDARLGKLLGFAREG